MVQMVNESPIVKRLFDLIRERGVIAAQVTKDIGISGSSFTDWKKGKGKPSVDTLVKLSSYFGVSLDYLINGKEYVSDWATLLKVRKEEIFISAEEKELASKFRMMPAEYQEKAMIYINGMLAALETDSGENA